jgi:hypothetical protein
MNAAVWFYSQAGFHAIHPEPVRTECAYSLTGCSNPKTPYMPGAPLVSHGICPECKAQVLGRGSR